MMFVYLHYSTIQTRYSKRDLYTPLDLLTFTVIVYTVLLHFNSLYHFYGRPYSNFMLLWPLCKEGQLGRLKNDNHINILATILLQYCTNSLHSYSVYSTTCWFSGRILVSSTLVFIHTEDDAIMTFCLQIYTHSIRQQSLLSRVCQFTGWVT